MLTKRIWVLALIICFSWIIGTIIFNSIKNGRFKTELLIGSVVSGLVMGPLLSLTLSFLGYRAYKKTTIEFDEGESAIKEGIANCYYDQSYLGKLVLTNKRLIFKANAPDREQEAWDLNKINKINEASLNLFDDGFIIELADNKKYKFGVNKPGAWVSQITSSKK